MACGHLDCCPVRAIRTWPEEFKRHRQLHRDEKSYPAANREIGARGDDIALLFQCYEYFRRPSPGTAAVKRFCHGATIGDLELGSGATDALIWRAASLHDSYGPSTEQTDGNQSEGSCQQSEYRNPLTAAGLFREMKAVRELPSGRRSHAP
jgi:hypothetical protein